MKPRRGEKFAWIVFAAVPIVVLVALFAPLAVEGSVADVLTPHATAKSDDPDLQLCPPGHKAYAIVTIKGLKDDKGDLILEVYPDNEEDFLKNRLGRTDAHIPSGLDPKLCVELPGPGRYAIVVHHDRDADNKFDLFKDGYGFSRNPHIVFSTPDVQDVAVDIKHRITRLTIDMHYVFSGSRPTRHGGKRR